MTDTVPSDTAASAAATSAATEQTTLLISGYDSAAGKYFREAFSGSRLVDIDAAGFPSEYVPADTLLLFIVDADDFDSRLERAAAAIASRGPLYVAILSSDEVYTSADSEPTENSRLSPDSEHSRRCLQAEQTLAAAAVKSRSEVSVFRPAMMFGNGIGGRGERLFRKVMSGRFFVVRDADGLRSAVCCLDVARVVRELFSQRREWGGVYNVSDGRKHRLADLATAMTANAGAAKRVVVLVPKLARMLAAAADFIPGLRDVWGRRALAEITSDRTLDSSALQRRLPDYEFFDTAEVIARRASTYPYEQQ